jgi:hypothetical protein
MQSLIKHIIDHGTGQQSTISQLEDAFNEHPYSPTLAVLLTKAYKEQNNIHFEVMLSRSALLAQQRKNLHALLYALLDSPANKTISELNENHDITTHETQESSGLVPLSEVSSIEGEDKSEDNNLDERPITRDPDELLTNQYLAEALSAGILINSEADEVADDSDNHFDTTNRNEAESSHVDSASNLPEKENPAPDKLGFTAWLDHLSDHELERSTDDNMPVTPALKQDETSQTESKIANAIKQQAQSVNTIIDHFIQKEDEIVPKRARFFTPEKAARESLEDKATIVTETLARIYAQQGNISKAIMTYEKLSLLHPEKSSYFAALIKNLKKD